MSEITGRRGVLDRAFDILSCFGGGVERSVADVCSATELPPATVHRMLATLSELGAIERTSWGRYRLGPSLWRLGHDVHDIRKLRDCARPALIDLHASTRLPVALATREGNHLQVIDKIAGRKVAQAWTALGTPLLTKHPGGLVLLAWGSTPGGVPAANQDEFAWRQGLADIRRQGFAHTRPSTKTTSTAIWAAAPVFGADRSVSTCVMIGGVRGQHPPVALARLARSTADEISDGLRLTAATPVAHGAEA